MFSAPFFYFLFASRPPTSNKTVHLLGLVLDALDTSFDRGDVTKVTAAEGANALIGGGRDYIHVVVELVDEGSAGGNVELGDLGLVDIVQMLDEGAERVAVGSDDNVLTSLEVRNNTFLPVGEDAIEGGGEGLGEVLIEGVVGVAGIVGGMMLGRLVDGGRRDVVGASPDQNLVLAVLVNSLLLVEALKRAVVALVELPRLVHGNPHKVGLLKNMPQGSNGALEQGGMRDGRAQALCLD